MKLSGDAIATKEFPKVLDQTRDLTTAETLSKTPDYGMILAHCSIG